MDNPRPLIPAEAASETDTRSTHSLVLVTVDVDKSCIAHGKQWVGLIVRGKCRFKHALVAPKWLHTMNLAVEGTKIPSLQQAKH